MNTIRDTLEVMLHRWPDAFALWVLVALAPLATLVICALLFRPKLSRRISFVRSSFALILGYPAAIVLLFVIPITVLNIFLVPVILDANPVSRTILSAPLTLANWLVWSAFWFAPLLWLVWSVAAPVFLARKWRGNV